MHNDTKNISVKKGGLYIADLPDDADGSLQSGTRPVVIVSNNMANKYSPVVTILPMTSRISKKDLPTHTMIEDCGLDQKSIVLAEQIMSVNKKKLRGKIGTLQKQPMNPK